MSFPVFDRVFQKRIVDGNERIFHQFAEEPPQPDAADGNRRGDVEQTESR